MKFSMLFCFLFIVLLAAPASAQADPYKDGFYHVTYGSRTDPRPCNKVQYLQVANGKTLYVCGQTDSDLKRVIYGRT